MTQTGMTFSFFTLPLSAKLLSVETNKHPWHAVLLSLGTAFLDMILDVSLLRIALPTAKSFASLHHRR